MKHELQNDYSIGEAKQSLRLMLRERRNRLDDAERAAGSTLIGSRLRRLSAYRTAKTIMIFLSHGSEVITDAFVEQAWKDQKEVVVPLVVAGTNRLKAARICSLKGDLAYGYCRIREPKPGQCKMVSHRKIDVVLVPGLGFDRQGNRIGYGKGFYDAWLKRFAPDQRIGLAFECQIVKRVPIDKNDVPVGKIVTDKRIVHCK